MGSFATLVRMTAQVATGSAEERGWATIPDEPFESQGSRRRAQLVTIAASLIVARGPGAVTHASVGELAGVGRTAVYRYFPRREDILLAVIEMYTELDAQHLNEDVAAGVLGLAASTRKRVALATRTLSERTWDADTWSSEALKLRLAMCILVRDHELMVQLSELEPDLAEGLDRHFFRPLREIGLNEVQQRLVTDIVVSTLYHASVAVLSGEIDYDEAADLTVRMSMAAVQACLD
jgi:AcrR family transcriptional regulator